MMNIYKPQECNRTIIENMLWMPMASIYFHNSVMYIDYGQLLWSLCSWPCHGQMISIGRVAMPKSIQVTNVGSIAEDNIRLYFESSKASGGDDVRKVDMNPKFDCAIVEFENAQGRICDLI